MSAAATLLTPSVRDALREFEDDLERAHGNLEEALSGATGNTFRQARFDCMIALIEEETEPVKVDTDNPFTDDNANDDIDTGDAVDKILRKAEDDTDDLITTALEDYDWEINQAMRRFKARLA